MMMPAQQDPVPKIGSAQVALPVHYVMRLREGRRSVTVGEPASAVSSGKADALTRGKESLVATEVDDLTVGIEEHRDHSRLARVPRRGGDGDGVWLAFESSSASATAKVVGRHVQANSDSASPEHRARVGKCCNTHEIDECVECDLRERASVVEEWRRLGCVNEARASAPGGRDRVDRADHDCGGLGVEQARDACHTVG